MQAPIVSTLLVEEPDMADLVDKYIAGLPESIKQITNAISGSDWAHAQRLIHDLKGMGGNFGFPELTHVAKQLESEVRLYHYHNINVLLQELESVKQRILLGRDG